MWPNSFDLISPLARDECVRRLRANTESSWVPGVFRNKPVSCRVEYSSFRIRKRIAYRNSFQPHLSGELSEEDGRTRIRCRLGMHPAVVAFMVIWFGGVVIGSGRVAMGAIGLVCCGVALGLGRFAGRNEPRFLLDFLRDTIAAREA
jgi:hypothetical protein